jgi:hypothetical protein
LSPEERRFLCSLSFYQLQRRGGVGWRININAIVSAKKIVEGMEPGKCFL